MRRALKTLIHPTSKLTLMLGISFSELILILLIALIVFGPEQLPSIIRIVGTAFTRVRNLSTNLKQQIYQHSGLEELTGIRDEMQYTLQQFKNTLATPSVMQPEFPDENVLLFNSYSFLYQPELDFESQPELFDEI